MLHSVFPEPSRHARHFSSLPHYVPDVAHYPHHAAPQLVPAPDSRYLNRSRPRGDDGRFVPRADDHHAADSRDRKVCGWCARTQTSQWRVGPTTGSLEMGTLCNACGINYRRALQKAPDGVLDLDQLAHQQGTRLSIQKALKRQRKLTPALSPALTQFKRSRSSERRHSSVNMLLSEDTSSPTSSSWHAPASHPAVNVPLTSLRLPPPPALPSMHSHYASGSACVSLPLPSSLARAASSGASSSRHPQHHHARQHHHHHHHHHHRHHHRNDRLPPFRHFIGNLPTCD